MIDILLGASLPELVFFVVAAIGIATAVIGFFYEYSERPVAAGPPIEWPPTYSELLAENGSVPARKPRHLTLLEWREAEHKAELRKKKHDLHCTRCGRFASRVPEFPGVGYCRYHGHTMRVQTQPITIPITFVNIAA